MPHLYLTFGCRFDKQNQIMIQDELLQIKFNNTEKNPSKLDSF